MQKISSFFEYLLENGQEAYREHFREILAEEGYSSIADIPAEKKAEFFAKVSKTWKDKKANESILREYAELCPVCHGHSTPEKENPNDKKCKGCGNYVHIESHAAVEESKGLSRARRQLKLEESEKGVDLRDDKSCKCKGCGNPVKEGMLLCEKCEERGFYIAPNGKVVSPEEDVKEHLELTTAEIKKMVDDSKDMTPEEQRKIALSLPMTACALYVLEMKKRHNKKVSI